MRKTHSSPPAATENNLITAPTLHFGQSATGFNRFSLLFNRWLFISPADFQLLKQAAFRKFVLQNLQSLLYIIINDLYFQCCSSLICLKF